MQINASVLMSYLKQLRGPKGASIQDVVIDVTPTGLHSFVFEPGGLRQVRVTYDFPTECANNETMALCIPKLDTFIIALMRFDEEIIDVEVQDNKICVKGRRKRFSVPMLSGEYVRRGNPLKNDLAIKFVLPKQVIDDIVSDIKLGNGTRIELSQKGGLLDVTVSSTESSIISESSFDVNPDTPAFRVIYRYVTFCIFEMITGDASLATADKNPLYVQYKTKEGINVEHWIAPVID